MLQFFAVYIPLVETCGIVVHHLNYDDDSPIRAGQVWRVVDHSQPPKWPPTDEDGNTVLNLNVVRPRSNATSSAGSRPPDFREDVKRRDGNSCAFTDRAGIVCQAAHIVNRHIGDLALRSILERTLEEDSDTTVARITDIDDPRLGIFMRKELHTFYDAGFVSIMATPNHVLGTDDIPPSPQRELPPTKAYPADGRRYTAQWITSEEPRRTEDDTVAANTDAAFAVEYMANTPASPPDESNDDREDAYAEKSASDNESDPDYDHLYDRLLPDRNAPVNLPKQSLHRLPQPTSPASDSASTIFCSEGSLPIQLAVVPPLPVIQHVAAHRGSVRHCHEIGARAQAP
ncbi:hypothetical protein CALVIDRAFT_374226 [Calocera viscosa TUFC12733]|uniref:HNH nuclease domain-containing protein n=1 Tax=Calocera viscosa (strain TUFC12733) TaxID=1330018 RepID=A0A167GSD3_CALVF|nr:hypothetical protein CALVIDRAFT_374226 [Calocera viscosa TUFC12733]